MLIDITSAAISESAAYPGPPRLPPARAQKPSSDGVWARLADPPPLAPRGRASHFFAVTRSESSTYIDIAHPSDISSPCCAHSRKTIPSSPGSRPNAQARRHTQTRRRRSPHTCTHRPVRVPHQVPPSPGSCFLDHCTGDVFSIVLSWYRAPPFCLSEAIPITLVLVSSDHPPTSDNCNLIPNHPSNQVDGDALVRRKDQPASNISNVPNVRYSIGH